MSAPARPGPCRHCGHSDSDCRNQTANAEGRRCLSCCYAAAVIPPSTSTYTSGDDYDDEDRKTTARRVAALADDDREPQSEAAAFVASASAAAFVLLAALVAVLLSSAALWTVASAVPMADARPGQTDAADYLRLWHQQRQQLRPQHHGLPPYIEQQQQQQQRPVDDASRQKRQLFGKSKEPGVVGLTFSLIGGTISDVREAFRNVSDIVRDTISEAAKPPTTTGATDGDQMMMAAGNTVENEIGGSSTAGPVDKQAAGQTLGKLLGRNYRGLRRLFNTELRSALKNSPGNVRDFAVELLTSVGQGLRPSRLITRGPIDGNMASASNR